MKKSILVVALVAICLSLFPCLSLASDTPTLLPPNQNNGAFQGESDFHTHISEANEKKDAMDSTEKKLSYQLLQLTDSQYLLPDTSRNELISQMKEQRQIAQAPVLNNANGLSSGLNVYVYIELKEGSTPGMLSKYVSKIEDQDMNYNLVTAWVDVNSLKSLAALDAVKSIQEVIPPVVYAGSFTSEGDSLLKADVARAMGADGRGIKVGIISDGVDNYQSAVASGDIPSNLTVLSNAVGGDEGTAMLEIVHDLAPSAKLYFHDCGSNKIAFNFAINALKNAGCDIICDDIGWIMEPFFEDGIVAQYIEDLISSTDIIYVSSAGNAGDAHYQGPFVDCGDGTADFRNGSTLIFPYLYTTLYEGENVSVVMEWNDPFDDSENDYDLYLFDHNTGDLLAQSPCVQDGDDDPLEYIYYTNNTGGNIYLDIVAKKRVPTDDNKTLEIYVYGGHIKGNNLVSADSIFGHPVVPGVLSCGAIRHSSPNDIEYFSSRGPVTMLTETRQKPDICGIDGVSITGAGGFGSYDSGRYYFYGTSAAAPHIAAVAAQLESRFPTFTATQIKQLILDNAVDLGDAGYDNTFGYGKANAYAAALSHLIVAFDSQGGSAVDSQTVAKDGKVTKPSDPVRQDYIFEGWYKERECTTPWNFSQDTVTQDTTLYPKYTKISFAVTFDSQGGSAVNSQNVAKDGKATKPSDPSRQGYIFNGWYKERECTTPWNFSQDTVTRNTTLYAKYTKMSYFTVTFDSQGGSAVNSQNVAKDGKATKPSDPSRQGYIFNGWYKERECKTPWNFSQDTVTQDTTLYAKYTKISFTVTFDSQGGGAVNSQTVAMGGKATKPSDPVRQNYIFEGWYKERECKTPWNFSQDIITQDTRLYAKYSKIKSVRYQTHVQNVGWQGWKRNGEVAGTNGKSLRLEGMYIDIEEADNAIEYRTHVQNIGWQNWANEGEMTGTNGRSLRLEAIQIRLKGDMAAVYDIFYRVHAQNIGWMDWAKNGQSAGTAGFSYRLEAIQIQLVLKGGTAPGSTAVPFRDSNGPVPTNPKPSDPEPTNPSSGVPIKYQTHVQNVGWQGWKTNGEVAGTSGQSLRLEGMYIDVEGADNAVEYRTHVQNIGWQGWVNKGEMTGTSGRSLRLEAIEIRLKGDMAANYDIYYRVHAQNIGWMDWAKNGQSAGTAGFSYRLEAIQIVVVQKGNAAPGPTASPFVSA